MEPNRSRVLVALLRGVNVGGHGKLPMEVLRAACAGLGLRDARTAGVEPAIALRSADELARVLAADPFPQAAPSLPAGLAVLFPAGVPSEEAKQALLDGYSGPEEMRFVGRELVVHYGAGMARSKLTTTRIERTLGLAVTGRNWNTVNALLRLAREMELAAP